MDAEKRSNITPDVRAAMVLADLAAIYAAHSTLDEDEVFTKVFTPLFRDQDLMARDPYEVATEMLAQRRAAKGDGDASYLYSIVCVFCAGALQAYRAGSERAAWNYVVQAAGFAATLGITFRLHETQGRSFARRGAAARHAENRAMKQEAIETYLMGHFSSKDDAAEKIAGKVVPAKFRTVRDWLRGVTKDP